MFISVQNFNFDKFILKSQRIQKHETMAEKKIGVGMLITSISVSQDSRTSILMNLFVFKFQQDTKT